jgi:hypothetical protein
MSTADKRTCANCACFAYMMPDGSIVESPENAQSVCRRNVPGARQVRIEVPRIQNGQPVIKAGRPVLEPATVFQYGYQPTTEKAVCYDGWRPLGTLPGVPAAL